MLGLTAATVMQFALLATAGSEYMDAYNRADEEGKPLLVLVGAEWCPGCRVMKDEAMPELRRRGGLKHIVFAEVDADAKPELCRKRSRRAALIPGTGAVHASRQIVASHAADRCPLTGGNSQVPPTTDCGRSHRGQEGCEKRGQRHQRVARIGPPVGVAWPAGNRCSWIGSTDA